MELQGEVLTVESEPQGGVATEWTGNTLLVEDASDFARDGGQFQDPDTGTVYSYTSVEEGHFTEEPDKVITVESAPAGWTPKRVDIYPEALDVYAEVETDAAGSVPAEVPYQLRPMLPEGLREAGQGERVVIVQRGNGWALDRISGRRAMVQADSVEGLNAALEELRARLDASKAELEQAQSDLAASKAERDQLLEQLRQDLSDADIRLEGMINGVEPVDLSNIQAAIDANRDAVAAAQAEVDAAEKLIAAQGVSVEAATKAAQDATAAASSAASQAADAQAKADTAATLADQAYQEAATAAGKATAVAQPTAPEDKTVLWIDTTNGSNTPKVWNGTAWTPVTDAGIKAAADKAAAAQVSATSARQIADRADLAAAAARQVADKAVVDAAAAQAAADKVASDLATAKTELAAADTKLANDLAAANTKLTQAQADIAAAHKAVSDAEARLRAADTQLAEDLRAAQATLAQSDTANQEALAQARAELEAAFKAGDTALASRGTDLIINGSGQLGTNENFSWFTFDPLDAPTGARGSFVTGKGAGGVKVLDQLIPYDPSKAYRLSFDARQRGTSTTSLFYAYIEPMDAVGYTIAPYFYGFQPGTHTTLARDINPGDTTIHLTSVENWFGQAGKPLQYLWQAGMQFWDYVDNFGRAWGAGEYTRNVWWNSASGKWDNGAVDPATNTIKLRAPYDGPAKPAGTPVSQPRSGGTYVYARGAFAVKVPGEWTNYSAVYPAAKDMPPVPEEGVLADWNTYYRPLPKATASLRVGFLVNYAPDQANSQHAVANVSLSDAAAAQVASAEALARADLAVANAKTADDKAVAAQASAATAAQQAAAAANASKAVVQSTAPLDKTVLWIDSANGNTPKLWNATVGAWAAVTDAGIKAAADAAAAAQATASTAQSTADTARNEAAAAQGAAQGAQTTATNALTIANGKTKTTYATGLPGATANTKGEQWFVRDATTKAITELWEGLGGTSWQRVQLDGTALVAESVSTLQLAAGAITAGKIAAGAVTTEKLTAGAVVADKIASSAITADKLAAASVVAGKIAANAVTASTIAANSVVAGKIAANAVTAPTIQAGAITAGKIAADAVTAAEIAAGAITTSELSAGAVTTEKLTAEAITADKLAALAVTAEKVAANAIAATNIQAGAVVAGKIAAGAVTATTIAADAVTADAIAANAVTTTELAAGAVVADKLAANSVTATKIVADAIGTKHLSALAITGDKIAASTITGDKIVVDKLLAQQIAATMATFQEVWAGKITADHIDLDTLSGKALNGVNIYAPSSTATPRVEIAGGTFRTVRADAEGVESVGMSLGGADADRMQLLDTADGSVLAGFDDQGDGVANTFGVRRGLTVGGTADVADLSVGGRTLQDLLAQFPQGVVARQRMAAGASVNDYEFGTSELGLVELRFVADANRLYRVVFDGLIYTTQGRYTLRLRREVANGELNPVEPKITSYQLAQGAFEQASGSSANSHARMETLIVGPATEGAQTSYRVMLSGIHESGGHGRIASGATYPADYYVEDVGPYIGDADGRYMWGRGTPWGAPTAPVAQPTTPVVTTKTYTSTWRASHMQCWKGGVAQTVSSSHLQQGYYPKSQRYSSVRWVGANGTGGNAGQTPKAALTGSRVAKLEVYLSVSHAYASAGGTLYVGLHKAASGTTNPQTSGGSAFAVTVKKGFAGWIELPTTWATDLATGAADGITLGEGAGTNLANYIKVTADPSQLLLRAVYTK